MKLLRHLCGGLVAVMALAASSTFFLARADEIKDCSALTDCHEICQCNYDNCSAGCGPTDAQCVKRCTDTWQDCNDHC